MDYAAEDTVNITANFVKGIAESKNGKDVIFTLDSKQKITLKNAGSKANNVTISYIDTTGEHTYPDQIDTQVVYDEDHKGATLQADYQSNTFSPTSDYSDYKGTLVTINAEKVEHNLTITGNDKANLITGTGQSDYINGGKGADTVYGGEGKDTLVGSAGDDYLDGGAGNDSLWGGAGEDTLFGGKGNDIFVYAEGEGDDTIVDYVNGLDKIVVTDYAGNITADSNGTDVYYNFSDGSVLTLQNAAKQYTELVNTSGSRIAYRSASR